jgi:hypothetical protein
MTTKYTKWPKIFYNGRKIDQMIIKYTKIFHCKTFQNLPKFDFLFENKPSGNPGYMYGKPLQMLIVCVNTHGEGNINKLFICVINCH